MQTAVFGESQKICDACGAVGKLASDERVGEVNAPPIAARRYENDFVLQIWKSPLDEVCDVSHMGHDWRSCPCWQKVHFGFFLKSSLLAPDVST